MNGKRSIVLMTIILIGIAVLSRPAIAQERLVINDNNEFGGRTIEYTDTDTSLIREFYDDDENKIKEERIFTTEYPIDNGLRKIVTFYAFDKIIKEEKVYTSRISQNTLIKMSTDYFDRYTGLKTKTENHFIDTFSGFNVVYRKNGKKTKIEWNYPKVIDGIVKNIVFFDDEERAVKVESLYAPKTIQEKGYYRRVYYNEYSPNRYFRKYREEWYYTDEYAKNNNGIYKMVKHFHYRTGKDFDVEVHVFNKNNELIFTQLPQ